MCINRNGVEIEYVSKLAKIQLCRFGVMPIYNL